MLEGLSLQQKLEFFQRKVELYDKISAGRCHLYINDENINEDGVFMDQADHGITAKEWSYIPCSSLLFKIDERYDEKVKGGGSVKKALIGGFLFGTTGAIVGGAGRGKQTSLLTKLSINCYDINSKSRLVPSMSFKLIQRPVDTRTMEYQRVKDILTKFVSATQSRGAVYGGEEHKNI